LPYKIAMQSSKRKISFFPQSPQKYNSHIVYAAF
jgi:hypothetical protein